MRERPKVYKVKCRVCHRTFRTTLPELTLRDHFEEYHSEQLALVLGYRGDCRDHVPRDYKFSKAPTREELGL